MKNVKRAPTRLRIQPKLTADAMLTAGTTKAMVDTTDKVVVIGSSTGGTQALEVVLSGLPRVTPGVVVVQHMPENFTRSFSMRLDSICQVDVKEAVSGDRIVPGRVLIAQGGKHLLLKRSGAQYCVEVKDGPLVGRHRPSVDVLFSSAAEVVGHHTIAVLLTGMGTDGAEGMAKLRTAGAHTIAQSARSCVVYGMPKAAVELDAVRESLPLEQIAGRLNRLLTPVR